MNILVFLTGDEPVKEHFFGTGSESAGKAHGGVHGTLLDRVAFQATVLAIAKSSFLIQVFTFPHAELIDAIAFFPFPSDQKIAIFAIVQHAVEFRFVLRGILHLFAIEMQVMAEKYADFAVMIAQIRDREFAK